MSPELLSFLGSISGLSLGCLMVWWMTDRQSRRKTRLWADLNTKPTITEPAAPTTAEPIPSPPGTLFVVIQDGQIVGQGVVGENDHPGWREPNINWDNLQLPRKD